MSNPNETREVFERRLALFWEVAQPLKLVFRELPELSAGFPATMRIKFPTAGLESPPDLTDLVHRSVESAIALSFPNLPEELFERLALRFRPFFAQGEETHFLRVISSIAGRDRQLARWQQDLKKRWHRAVFWGAMAMPERTPPVTPDAIINAGFYARYFHVSHDRRREARTYEESLGADIFRVALVSSVWQRSGLVIEVANQIQDWLVANSLLDDAAIAVAADPGRQPERIQLNLTGGVGAVRLMPAAASREENAPGQAVAP